MGAIKEIFTVTTYWQSSRPAIPVLQSNGTIRSRKKLTMEFKPPFLKYVIVVCSPVGERIAHRNN